MPFRTGGLRQLVLPREVLVLEPQRGVLLSPRHDAVRTPMLQQGCGMHERLPKLLRVPRGDDAMRQRYRHHVLPGGDDVPRRELHRLSAAAELIHGLCRRELNEHKHFHGRRHVSYGRAGARPRLTASIIVKNEADHLAGCLASLRGVVDEVVVVDTGSSDGSAAVAAGFGAVVLHHEWTGSFSEARNLGLDRATGEWILYIDVDERLNPVAKADVEALFDVADREGIDAFRVHFTIVQGCSHAYEWRLWRHDPAVRFEGIIHEGITPALAAKFERDGTTHTDTDVIRLVHHGYEGDQTRKHARNLPLLLAEAERTPTRPYLWNHLGRIYEALGQPDEARAMWDRAIQVVRDMEPSQRQLIDSLTYGDVLVRAVNVGKDESALLAEGLAWFPDNWLIRWASSVDAMNKGRYDEAVRGAQQIIEARPEQIHHGGLTYPTRLFLDWPHNLIGVCRFEQGRFAEAADAFDRARAAAPEVSEYAVKARLARARASAAVAR